NSRFMNILQDVLRDPFAVAVPLILLGVTVVAGLIVRKVLFRAVRRWAARSDSHLDTFFIESLRGPIFLWSLILGIHLATQNSEIPARYLHYIRPTLQVLWILSLTIAMSSLAGNLVRFYGGYGTGARAVTSLTQKLAQLIVVGIGLVWL